MKNWIFINLLR